jgi:ABC-type transport system involved in multi-copper enzyme maturation permease subunit
MNLPLLIFILLSVWFYVWIYRQVFSDIREQRRPGQPPPLPGQSNGVLGVFRWLYREVIGGGEGLAVMRALVMKEVRTLLASRKSFWLLFTLSLIISGYFIIFWQNNALSITVSTRALFSRRIFSSLYMIQYCGLGLISAVMASATVTTERENKTIDLLLATQLSREQVVLSKWFSNIVYQLVLYASLLPVQALTFQLGGVGLDDYLMAALLVTAAIASYGMVGLAVSCHVQRTVTALLASVGVSAAIGLILPAFSFFSMGANGAVSGVPLVFYLFMMALVFIVAWRIAWSGLARRDTFKPAIAKPVIDDQRILEERRTTWPFYLIDPLARPQDIADHQNPVYIKEQRVSPLGRLDINIRLCYAAMFLSFVLVLSNQLGGSFTAFRNIAQGEISFIILFVPVLAATSISKEYEENTIRLLIATPLSPSGIIWAKFRLALRFLAILCCSLAIVPAAFHMGMAFTGNGSRNPGGWIVPIIALVKITPSLLAWSALYAAVSLLCSSLCRRNVTAIVASYVSLLVLAASPSIIGFLVNLLESGDSGRPGTLTGVAVALLEGFRYYICPLLSPYFYFSGGSGGTDAHFFTKWEDWRQILGCLALTAGAIGALVESAKLILLRRMREG